MVVICTRMTVGAPPVIYCTPPSSRHYHSWSHTLNTITTAAWEATKNKKRTKKNKKRTKTINVPFLFLLEILVNVHPSPPHPLRS